MLDKRLHLINGPSTLMMQFQTVCIIIYLYFACSLGNLLFQLSNFCAVYKDCMQWRSEGLWRPGQVTSLALPRQLDALLWCLAAPSWQPDDMQINVQHWFWHPQQSFWRPCHNWSAFPGHPTKLNTSRNCKNTPQKPIWPAFWRPLWRPGQPLRHWLQAPSECNKTASITKSKKRFLVSANMSVTLCANWCITVQFKAAMPVNRSSPIRDLSHVLAFLGVEKLLSALSVLMGIVKSMVKNVRIKGNACLFTSG